MNEDTAEPFRFDGGVVEPGESKKFRYTVSETYLGDPIRIPVTIVNGAKPGPTVFLSAASHGDELNGIAVVREVVDEWEHSDIHGCLVGLPVLNVPGFITQQRYLPIYDRDLNRAFPGDDDSTSAKRIAKTIYENFIAPCDFGIDFHTSTRGRSNMFHVRADMTNTDVARLAHAFASHVIIDSDGSEGTLRRAATVDDIPTITVEMGQAHRFERDQIDKALAGVQSVFAEYGLYPQERVRWPGWRTIISGWDDRTWLRADTGGIVEMYHEAGDLVAEGDTICSITSPFKRDVSDVTAPFTGLIVGMLENPVVSPGNPICHFVRPSAQTRRVIESGRETPTE